MLRGGEYGVLGWELKIVIGLVYFIDEKKVRVVGVVCVFRVGVGRLEY